MYFRGKGQKFAKPQKCLFTKISSFKADCWNKTLLKPANICLTLADLKQLKTISIH